MSDGSPTDGPQRWETTLAPQFIDDLEHWTAHETRTARRVLQLMQEVSRHPYEGTGRPERLKHLGANMWSRRISGEHRLVYLVDEANRTIRFLQGRYHYDP